MKKIADWCEKKGTLEFVPDLERILEIYNYQTVSRITGMTPAQALLDSNREVVHSRLFGRRDENRTPFAFGLGERQESSRKECPK